MRPIERVFRKLPIALTGFFKYLYSRTSLRVFLCGSQPSNLQYDVRSQVGWLLEKHMGCKTFLGEDIPDFKQPKIDKNHLTIEVTHAKTSNLILMFLGSPGTMAEVTAFAMDKQVGQKTVVFNNKKYHGKKSFINQGPLKLLPKENVIPYDAESNEPTLELVKHLDIVLAKTWYKRAPIAWIPSVKLSFEQFICLAIIYSTFPVRYKDLECFYPYSEILLNETLKFLFDRRIIKKVEKKYIPRQSSDRKLCFFREHLDDIGKVRLNLLGKRLKDEDVVSDYRLIF